MLSEAMAIPIPLVSAHHQIQVDLAQSGLRRAVRLELQVLPCDTRHLYLRLHPLADAPVWQVVDLR